MKSLKKEKERIEVGFHRLVGGGDSLVWLLFSSEREKRAVEVW